MPEISRFLGIVVRIYFRDHLPAHFHARYGEYRVKVFLQSGIVEGRFPRRALRHLMEGYDLHRAELEHDWALASELDLGRLIRFRGVFATLQDEREFARVRVDAELGTITWPNGADVDPDVLYAELTGTPIDTPGTT